MANVVLIHGAGDSGWAWHLLEAELRRRGHATVAPDLPSEDDACGFSEYADAVVGAAASLDPTAPTVVVGHSLGGFTAPLVAERLGAGQLVLLAAMVPTPGESADEWWEATGYGPAVAEQSARDGGLTGHADELVSFYNGVPPELAAEAGRHALGQSATPMAQPFPLLRWPAVATRFLLARDDRFFPADLFRTLVPRRLGITPEEVPGGHCMMLSHPEELADQLLAGGPARRVPA